MGPRITLQTLAILSAFLERPEDDWYGLELSRMSGIKSGTMYPALIRLEAAGWLESRWETIDPALEGRPRRRLYRLTGVGADSARNVLDEHLLRLRARQDAVLPARLRPAGGNA
jgi:PadR family transcriptional regulator PadR